MTCGLGLGIFLICLVQAELGGGSRLKVLGPKNGNTQAGFHHPEKLRNFGSYHQNQLRQSSVSPPSVQKSRNFNTNPAVSNVPGQKLFTSGFMQALSKPIKSSGRLVKGTKPSSQSTGSSATLFRPVGSGPPSSVRMQTYARAPAKRVGLSGTRGFSPPTGERKSYLRLQNALNVGGFKPRSRLQLSHRTRVDSTPGFAPVMIHEIPEPFGGFAIRRLRPPTEQKVPVQKMQQMAKSALLSYNPDLMSFGPGSDRTRMKQTQGLVQTPQQSSTPSPAYSPDLNGAHPAPRWTKVKVPHRLQHGSFHQNINYVILK
ncbi:uncharacterized protein LOC119794909 [Cyprinodon tularosa]|uniref:uncharacterized protein LOC119794909 n=1 Tax=Cyprinodon tularosa TaxID=77115 RepID=UPI0018E21570|nr:uncharacterized protein LOC119794909 [Cyprinodon tularosa]